MMISLARIREKRVSGNMTKEKKSYDLHVELPDTVSKNQVMDIIEKAANSANLYISHIGSYSRKKYPN